MSFSGYAFLVEEAAKNIRRNGLMSLAALTTVTIALAVFGGATFALYHLHRLVEASPRQFEIAAFLDVSVPRDKALDVVKRAEAVPGVAKATLYPKELAWTELQGQDKERQAHVTDALAGDNPLPDRLDIQVKDPGRTRQVSAALRDTSRFPEVHAVRDARQEVETLMATSRLVRNVGGIAAIVLFLATALVIQNTLRLTVFARRREIRIMQLVGATAGFIRLPIVLEGLFYGMVGALLASGIVAFVTGQVLAYTHKVVSPLAEALPRPAGASVVVGVLLGVGMLVGWTGSFLSIRRFLRRI